MDGIAVGLWLARAMLKSSESVREMRAAFRWVVGDSNKKQGPMRGPWAAAVVDDEMELARMGYKQDLKCVSSLHLFQRAFSSCIPPPQARPHAPPGTFSLRPFPLFSIRYTLCKNVAFSGAFMTHTHLLDAKVSLPIHPG